MLMYAHCSFAAAVLSWTVGPVTTRVMSLLLMATHSAPKYLSRFVSHLLFNMGSLTYYIVMLHK